VDATPRKCREASFMERTGAERKRDSAQPQERSLTETVSVSDHPVCAASEASRLFITGAATPPLKEGNIGHSYLTAISFTLYLTARCLLMSGKEATTR